VSFRCEDPESPIVLEVSDLAPKRLTESGVARGSCVNLSGSTASVGYDVRIDSTPPRVIGGLYPSAGAVALGALVPSGLACADSESGIATCLIPGWLDTSTPGVHSVSTVAKDHAGHASATTFWYHVAGAESCVDDGWRQFSAPMFRDERDCVTALNPTVKGQR
jgi:hypothetical protein